MTINQCLMSYEIQLFQDKRQNSMKMAKFQEKSFVHRIFPLFLQPVYKQARMAELVDALDSKSSDSNIVPVRFRRRVQRQKPLNFSGFCRLSFFVLILFNAY